MRYSSSDSAFSTSSTIELVESQVRTAVAATFGVKIGEKKEGPSNSLLSAMVFQGKQEFGDYQCNVAMALSKELKIKPRDVAERLMKTLMDYVADSVSSSTNPALIGSMDISGPGFINIHLSPQYLQYKLQAMQSTDGGMNPSRLGIARTTNPERIVVDFSSPNIAKEMHVVSIYIWQFI